MSVQIAQTAIVDPRATIGDGVKIGHYSVIGPDVEIGANTRIDEHCVFTGQVSVGPDNRFYAGCVIGGDPQDTSYQNTPAHVVIGQNNIFREHCTVNRGTEKEDRITVVGDDNFFMTNVHIAHDCKVGNRIVIANNGMLGGHVKVFDDVIFAGGVGVSHYATVGSLSFVSAMSRVLHDVPPFTIVDGQPTRPRAVNTIGLKRHGFDAHAIKAVTRAFRLLYRARVGVEKAREEIFSTGPVHPSVKYLFDCVDTSCSGRAGRGQDQRNQQQKKKAA